MPPRPLSRRKAGNGSVRGNGAPRGQARAARPSGGRPAPSRPAYDWLRLAGIQAYGHLGVTAKERELGQRVEVDVELAYAPTARRKPDSLAEYIDYEEVGRMVRSQIEMSRCKLIETLAEELALLLLEEFETPQVRVRLRKLHVPVSGFTGVPEIEIERERE
jgi:7,8-dihydroneopterin aldolase/epimerase/oxygenase